MGKDKDRINKDGESYFLQKCEDCGVEMKVSMRGRKYCLDCKIKRQKMHGKIKIIVCPHCGGKI